MNNKWNVMRTLLVLCAAGLLAACGGGGSAGGSGNDGTGGAPGGSGPTGGSTTPVDSSTCTGSVTTPTATNTVPSRGTLAVSTTTINVQAPVNQQDASQAVQVSLKNITGTVWVGGTYTTCGIDHLGTFSSEPQSLGSDVQFQLNINFKNPSQLAPGTYRDFITLHACLETPCVNEIAGSPQTISVTYTVVALTGPPAMTLPQNDLSLTDSLLDPMAPPEQEVSVGFSNIPNGEVPFVFLSSTSNTISRAAYYPSGFGSTASGRVELNLKLASELGTGTFTDTVTVKACMDANCTSQLAGSPANITLHYTVANVQSGTGYRARAISVKANDMVWDAGRQLIYVAMAADAPANANTIGVLDPVSATFTSYVPVGNDPRHLEMSPDGQYLYVGLRGASQIQRLALPSLALDLTIPLVGSFGPELYAWEMHASPDSPHTLGVVRADASNNAWDLVVYDDAVMRPTGLSATLAAQKVSSFQWDTGSRIFGFYGPTTTASRIDVSAGGVQMTASQQLAQTSVDRAVYLFNNRMYTQRGRVFDPLTFALIGSFPLDPAAGTPVLALDASQGKAFFLTAGTIKSFDASTLTALGSIPAADGDKMIRWGQNGLALMNSQPLINPPGIVLIDGTFVKP